MGPRESHTVVLETSANPQKPLFRKRLLRAEIDLPALFESKTLSRRASFRRNAFLMPGTVRKDDPGWTHVTLYEFGFLLPGLALGVGFPR